MGFQPVRWFRGLPARLDGPWLGCHKLGLDSMLKWAGTGMCGVVLMIAVANLVWISAGIHFGTGLAIGVWGGCVEIIRDPRGTLTPVEAYAWRAKSLTQVGGQWAIGGAWPDISRGAYPVAVTVPLWMLGLPCFVLTARLWWRDWRRMVPNTCVCGYDLTGNTSGRCPECGRARTNVT